ncbi:leucine-rich repeat domain-containing protein [Brachyspira intermedia]|nr:leucine-rich repeat domain-containing protein [Brachyspira intermedia]
MIKKILLVLVSVLVFVSCSNNTTSPDSSNNGDNSGVTPPIDNEEQELIKKYGIDISQEDAVISQKIEENLRAYFAEKNSYRVILTGTPRSYKESLSSLIAKVASGFQNIDNIDIDIRYINFQGDTISGDMFSGPTDNGNITFNFIFPENKIKTIGDKAFSFLSNLKEITIPASVTKIGVEAFRNCDNLVKLNLKNGLEVIDNMAFLQVPFLSEVIIPDSVKTIGDQAFANDTIQKLQLSSSLETIGSDAFMNLEIEELIIPASVKTIGNQAFAYSFTALKRVIYYGDSPNIINYTGNVFEGCFSLSTLIIPNAENDKDPKWETFLGGSFTDIRKQ